MRLNTLQRAPGAVKKALRVGRGPGSGVGKTCGRGHKGQKARAGGYHKVGFEGGQMPLQRRLPKVGFTSKKSLLTQEVRLDELNQVQGDVISLETLIEANVLAKNIKFTKIILSGELKKAVTVQGLKVTKGARAAIEALGGSIV